MVEILPDFSELLTPTLHVLFFVILPVFFTEFFALNIPGLSLDFLGETFILERKQL